MDGSRKVVTIVIKNAVDERMAIFRVGVEVTAVTTTSTVVDAIFGQISGVLSSHSYEQERGNSQIFGEHVYDFSNIDLLVGSFICSIFIYNACERYDCCVSVSCVHVVIKQLST